MADWTGKTVGRYHVIETLGRGGMAVVYRAYDTRLRREVALKVIRSDSVPSEQLETMLKRFEREAVVLARLSHPNIVHVHDYGDFEGEPYLVMELVEGGTLSQRMGEPWAWAEAARMLAPVARALEYAHAHNLVHRDVKPGNILLTEGNVPKISDFGIAKILEKGEVTLTGVGVGIGSPEYMAPEQGAGETVDHRADIYALGVVFYEMVTGRKPFTADTPLAIVYKHMYDPLVRPCQYVPQIAEKVERVLFMALAKKPADRYQHMADFAAQLEKLAARHSVPSESSTLSTPALPSQPMQAAAPLPEPVYHAPVQPHPQTYPSYPSAPISPQSAAPKRPAWTIALAAGGILLALLCLGVVIVALLPGSRESITAFLRSPTPTRTRTPRPTHTERPTDTEEPTATARPTFTLSPVWDFTSTPVGWGTPFISLPTRDSFQDFSAVTCAWEEYYGDGGWRGCQDQAYTIVAQSPNAIWAWGAGDMADGSYATDVTILSGTDASAAVFCRYSYEDGYGTRAYYGHAYPTSGWATIGIFNGPENYVLIDWLTPAALQTGYGVTNRVELSCIGNIITLYINGQNVASVQDNILAYGSAGVFLFAGSDTAEGYFDNFSIAVP